MTTRPSGRGAALRRGLVEAEILERAAGLFAARGFAATSMQDIADALGSSRPALYHYFSSKDEILGRLIRGLAAATEAALRAAPSPGGTPASKLRELVAALVAPVAESPSRFRLILTSDAAASGDARDLIRKLERSVFRAISDVLAEGMAGGAFRRTDQRSATFVILGMINWVAWWYSPEQAAGERAAGIGDLCAAIADMAVASVAADSGTRAGNTPAEVISTLRRELGHLERLIDPAG